MAGAGFHRLATHEQAWEWLLEESEFDIALLQEAIPPPEVDDMFTSVMFQQRFPDSKLNWGNCILSRDIEYQEVNPAVNTQWESFVRGPSLIAQPVSDGPWLVNVHSNAKHIPNFEIEDFRTRGGLTCHSKQVWEIEVIAHELQSILSTNEFVLGGDLNSALLLDKIYRRKTNKRLWANLEAQGIHDLRPLHSLEEQQTFFRDNTHPYQLDHLFGSKTMLSKTALWKVLPEIVTEMGLSDHAPIIIEISL